jgi:hypothetical protein
MQNGFAGSNLRAHIGDALRWDVAAIVDWDEIHGGLFLGARWVTRWCKKNMCSNPPLCGLGVTHRHKIVLMLTTVESKTHG